MTTDNTNHAQPKPARRMARSADMGTTRTMPESPATRSPGKLDRVEAMLVAGGGTSIAEIMAATGWQQHSVRGAMAGPLKKRGLSITSEKVDGVRRYRASVPA